jgi:predicted Zn finger-like uncharacterized protein
MLIVCPSCAMSYRVETACFGEAGRLMRCVRCGDVWLGTESLLVPSTTVAENEQAKIGAGSAPECDREHSTPESFPDMEGLPEEADTFEPVAATSELHGDAPEDCAQITPEFLEFAPQEPPTASTSFLAGPASPRWDASVLPAPIEAATFRPAPQAYVLRKPQHVSPQRSRSGALCLLIAVLALVALHSAFIGWRRKVVKIAPQTASLYRAVGLPVNLRGLSITNITTAAQLHEGVPLLLVEGTIASTSTRPVKVPRLRLALRNNAGQELYTWTEEPERRTLPAGETLTFRTRLASPPPEAHDVVVRFFNRDDMPGMQQSAAMRTSRRGQP